MSEADEPHPGWKIGPARLVIGLMQGLALYGLAEASASLAWPSAQPILFGALILAVGLGPFVPLAGVGRIRPIVLAALTVSLAACVAGFGWHDVARQDTAQHPHPTLEASAVFFSAIFVFIGYHLVAPADAARRWIAPHAAYFDAAWKNAVQLALSVAFVAVMWGALELGAALFKLIGIKAFADIIDKRWFIFPVIATAFAAAVQITDVRIGLIRGIRTVGLVLLSWLLPLMTLIAVAFLVALPFTGLAPLFATRSASTILLSATGALVILINAAYQDGEEGRVPAVLRQAARLAAVCLIPLVAIAAFALFKRVHQYGWTPERIDAAACVLVGAGYAGGYTTAALTGFGGWMKLLEKVNIVMAVLAMVAIFALFTPIADPARLSVDNQISRLLNGATAPDKFDYAFLRFRAGRYGYDALAGLKRMAGTPARAKIASLAANAGSDDYAPGLDLHPLAPAAERIAIFPAGAALPPDFLDQKRAAWMAQQSKPGEGDGVSNDIAFGDVSCLKFDGAKCDAYVLDIDGDGHPEVLMTTGFQPPGDSGMARLNIFKRDAAGHWPNVGELSVNCPASIAALRTGKIQLSRRETYDIQIGGVAYKPANNTEETCSATWPKTPPTHY